jgi:flagellar biosynthesis protein FliP
MQPRCPQTTERYVRISNLLFIPIDNVANGDNWLRELSYSVRLPVFISHRAADLLRRAWEIGIIRWRIPFLVINVIYQCILVCVRLLDILLVI